MVHLILAAALWIAIHWLGPWHLRPLLAPRLGTGRNPHPASLDSQLERVQTQRKALEVLTHRRKPKYQQTPRAS